MPRKDFSRYYVNPTDPIRHAEEITHTSNVVVEPATRGLIVRQAGNVEVIFSESNTATNTYTSSQKVIVQLAADTVYAFSVARIFAGANTSANGIIGLW